MAVTNIYTNQGRIISQKKSSGSMVRYLPDVLGSVTAVREGKETSKTSYTPYGQGSSPGTLFGWVGCWGYYANTLQTADFYIRARHYSSKQTRWISQDSIWPRESAFTYVGASPTRFIDSTGFGPASPVHGAPPDLSKPPFPIPWARQPGRGVQGTTVVCAGTLVQVCVIFLGVEACYELCTYTPGHPSGPLTYVGECLGKAFSPDPVGNPAPAPVPKPPRQKPPREGCSTPCPPPCYRLDLVPPGRPHHPCPGDHIHWTVWDQGPPPNCGCFFREIFGGCWPQFGPPPRSIPECPKSLTHLPTYGALLTK